jgi:2Fe-2S ferredoxin
MSHKVTLWPSGEIFELEGAESLLKELKKVGKNIKSSCGGCATCTDCMIVVKSGESNLSPQTFEELRLLGNVFHITKERLSCQAKVTGEVTLDISSHEKNASKGKAEASSGPKSTTVRLKKREDIQKSVRENEEKDEPKPSDDWYRHWEKGEQPENQPKRLGGNRRPRSFNYSETDKDDEENK